MRGDGTSRRSRSSTPGRNSSSGSGCISWWQVTTTPPPTTAACSARASGSSSTPPPASTSPNRTVRAGVRRCAGLRLRHLRGRQHGRRSGIGARRSRIRLSHRRTGAGSASARCPRRRAPGRAGDRRRRRADRHRGRHRARRAGPQGHPGLWRPVGADAVRAGPSLGGQGAGQAAGRRARSGRGDRGAARTAVVFEDGAVRPSAITVWTAGFGVPDLAAASGLRTDAIGRLLTDETLTSVDDRASSPRATAPLRQTSRCACAARRPRSSGPRPPTPC